MTKKHNLYVDLDGVMANYNAGFLARFGCTSLELEANGGSIWETIGSAPSFYEDLPVMEGALPFWESLRLLAGDAHLAVLTSAGTSHFHQNARSKERWVRKHLSGHPVFVPVTSGRRKGSYAHGQRDVLIDDWEPNGAAWVDNGGHFVHHAVSFADTLAELEQLMLVTNPLPAMR